MKTLYDKGTRACSNVSGHMTKMADTAIYGKHLKLFFSEASDLGTWYVALGMLGPTKLIQIMILG